MRRTASCWCFFAGLLFVATGERICGQGLDCALAFRNDRNVSSDPTIASDVAIAAGSGVILTAWVDSGGGLRWSRSIDGGVTYAASQVVPGSTSCFHQDIVTDGTNAFIAAGQGNGASSGIRIFRSADGGLSFVPVTPPPAGAATSVAETRAALHQGRLFVAYDAFSPTFTGPEVFMNFSADFGQTWLGTPVNISQSPLTQSRNPSIAAGGQRVSVAYREGNALRLQLLDLNGVPVQPFRTIASYANPAFSLRTDATATPDGQFFAFMFNDLLPGIPQIEVLTVVSTDGANSFSPALNITQNLTVSRPGDLCFNGPKLLACWDEVGGTVPGAYVRCFDVLNGSSGPAMLAAGTSSAPATGTRGAANAAQFVLAYVETLSTPTGTTNDVHTTSAPLCGALSTVGSGGCAGSSPAPTWTFTGTLCGTYNLCATWAPNAPGVLGVSDSLAPSPLLVGTCPIELNFTNLFVIPIQTDAAGHWMLQLQGPVPASLVFAQTAFGDAGSPNGIAVSPVLRHWTRN